MRGRVRRLSERPSAMNQKVEWRQYTGPPKQIEAPICKRSPLCKGCQFAGHGFFCWGADGECMQTRLLNISRRKSEDMKGFPTQEQVYHLREKYPVGTRLELDHMDDRWAVPKETKGTVTHVDDAGQIPVKWDNGRGLAVIPGVDSFHIVQGQQPGIKIGGMAL